ncbi:retrovirus-related pol polyprotein from transposon TNT 1-94 [Tanacetum coccineum]
MCFLHVLKVIQIVLWIVDSGCSKHMTRNLKLRKNFVEKFMETIRFVNDQSAEITGYGDYLLGSVTICHVYYVEGLKHNIFSVDQFCDDDLEVAFRSKMCYVRDLEGEDLLSRVHDSNLYKIAILDMAASSPMCLSHLNFGKSKRFNLKPKLVPSVDLKLELIHMDLCGPMRDEASEMIIKFITQIQVNLRATIQCVRTDNGIKFKNDELKSHYGKLGITHQTSIARTPQ